MLTTLPNPGHHPAFTAARAHAAATATGVKTTIAGCVALGLELLQLQTDLGYVQGGTRRGEAYEKPDINWKDLVAQETGFTYQRCRDFMKTAEAIRKQLTASRKKEDAPLRQILLSPPAVWSQVDYCEFADAIGAHFDAHSFAELMEDLGLLTPKKQLPPPPPDDAPDPYAEVRAAHDVIAVPVLTLHRTMSNPETFLRSLHELPVDDQPADEAAGIPQISGLKTLATIIAQAQEQITRVIQERSKARKAKAKDAA